VLQQLMSHLVLHIPESFLHMGACGVVRVW
jgi:hypothetical protein